MNKIVIFLLLLFFSFSIFAQKAEYMISAGANYNFFTISSYNTEYQQNIPTNSGYTSVTTSTYKLEINSTGASGFFVKNDFSFPVNKVISFNTGFGISLNNSDLTIKSKSTYNSNGYTFLDSSYIFVLDTGTVFNYNYEYINSSDYNIFLLNIPIQLQIKLFKEKLNLVGGLSISALMQAKKTYSINDGKNTIIATNDFENIFFNVNFGFSYNLFDNIYAGIKYDYSVTDVFRNSDSQSYSYNKNYSKPHLNNISLILSYKF